MRLSKYAAFVGSVPIFLNLAALAGESDVVAVSVSAQEDGRFRFDVTVRHDDEGWDHYADVWEVVGKDGTVYGQRVLAHPHVSEQPFTRSQSGIDIPTDVSEVMVRSGDKVHGFGGEEKLVKLPGR